MSTGTRAFLSSAASMAASPALRASCRRLLSLGRETGAASVAIARAPTVRRLRDALSGLPAFPAFPALSALPALLLPRTGMGGSRRGLWEAVLLGALCFLFNMWATV